MNLLGRLFIVLIFVGSVMFMAMTVALYATHTNWKAHAQSVKAELDQKTQAFNALRKQMEDTKSAMDYEIKSQVARNVALLTEIEQLRQTNEEKRIELAEKSAQLDKQVDVVANVSQETSRLRVRLDETSKKFYESQNAFAEMSTELVRQMDIAHSLALQVSNYQTISAQLANDYRDAVEVLRRLGITGDLTLFASNPPVGIRGMVTEVRPGGFVEISVGVDSGLVKGHHLDVIRDREGRSSYVGKIEITNVVADRAIAKIMPEYRRGVVQRGDEVTYIEVNEFVAH